MNSSRNSQKRLHNEQGIALILVLLVVAALSVLILELNYTTRVNLHLSENLMDETKAYFLARGAVEAAIYLLKEENDDSDEWDAICEQGNTDCENLWSIPPVVREVGDGSVELKIEDESGKIWINDVERLFKRTRPQQPASQQPKPLSTEPKTGGKGSKPGNSRTNQPAQSESLSLILQRLLRDGLQLEDDEVYQPIMDWMDADDDPLGTYGAEDSYYKTLELPYDCRNAPFVDLSELLLVKGVTDDLYFGGGDHPVGLKDVFTVFGNEESRINVNTAPAEVLKALHPDILGEEIVEEREGAPFMNVNKFLEHIKSASTDQRLSQKIRPFVGVRSDYFSAYVRIWLTKDKERNQDRPTKSVRAVLHRDEDFDNVTIVYWREE